MSGASKKLMGTTAVGGGALAIEDVFSTYLYAGTDSTQTITNGIDLAGEGGLVWIKARNAAYGNFVVDTERGVNVALRTDATLANLNTTGVFTSFNSDGFSLVGNNQLSDAGYNFASWTWRKAPRFFDVVQYTGTGANQNIVHNLGVVPGFVVVKKLNATGYWSAWHRSLQSDAYILLNTTGAAVNSGASYIRTVTDTTYQVFGSYPDEGANGSTYVAYLFAHDPLGPSEDGSDGLIACGSYEEVTGANTEVTLGWEPQFVIKKAVDTAGDWVIHDSLRGIATGGNDARLRANDTSAENSSSDRIDLTSTGFINKPEFGAGTIIYIAIRRGPMRQPTSGTEVFAVDNGDGSSVPSFASGFPVDFGMMRDVGADGFHTSSRLTSGKTLDTYSTAAEGSNSNYRFDYQNGWFGSALPSNYYSWMFRRAPGFFDVVAYTDGPTSLNHNLGVTPELIIAKNRGTGSWRVTNAYSNGLLYLDATNAASGTSSFQFLTPCDETTVNLSGVSQTGNNIAYLFASCPGVSKVGSYVGTGAAQTIDCGFTTGARFILIRGPVDVTGNWWVWDTERGITVGDDKLLSLNTTDAEATLDSVDPHPSGFSVEPAISSLGKTYIFLAIA